MLEFLVALVELLWFADQAKEDVGPIVVGQGSGAGALRCGVSGEDVGEAIFTIDAVDRDSSSWGAGTVDRFVVQ